MPFLLLWQGWAPAGVQPDDTCLIGDIRLLTYPIAVVADQSPISIVALSSGVPLALLPVGAYPLALLSIRTYPKATIVRVEPTTVLPGAMEVLVYPHATIGISPAVPTATIECKEHV